MYAPTCVSACPITRMKRLAVGYSGRAHCSCNLRVSLRCESRCWGAQPRVQGLYTGLVRSGQAWGWELCSGSRKRKA